MANPETLTLRNLSATPITITRISRFPQPSTPKPQPIRVNNITNIGNLAHSLADLVTKTLPHLQSPSRAPSSEAIASSAEAFCEQDTSISIPAFCNIPTSVRLVAGQVLRLTFTLGDGTHKFRTDLTGHAPPVHCLTPDATEHRFNAVFHRAHSHLALLSATSLSSWQSRLKDSTPLSSLSIPGTHNTPTCYPALPSVRCQSVPPSTQLTNGIRFFDVRCQVDAATKSLSLVHGAFPISLTGYAKPLTDVLSASYAFLAAHPSECIIISLKREGRGASTDTKFAAILWERYISPHAARWHLGSAVPTLGQARGKMVLFRRFAALPDGVAEFGIDAGHWVHNAPDAVTPSGACRVQDFCEVMETTAVETKVEYVKEHLKRAATVKAREVAAENQMFVNFLSGSNFWKVGCWPARIAETVNVECKRHLAIDHVVGSGDGDGGTGVVVCDYVGNGGDWQLVRLIVAMNAWIEKAGPGEAP